MNLEYYSNAALVTSVVVYLLAMTAYAAEWAAARNAPVEESADRRELAGVGARSAGTLRRTQPRPTAPRCSGSEPRPHAPTPDTRPPTPPSSSGWPSMKVELWGRIGVALTVVGFLCSVVGTTLRGSGRRASARGATCTSSRSPRWC